MITSHCYVQTRNVVSACHVTLYISTGGNPTERGVATGQTAPTATEGEISDFAARRFLHLITIWAGPRKLAATGPLLGSKFDCEKVRWGHVALGCSLAIQA